MDRNATAAEIIRRVAASLSARRAWIEIRITPTPSRLMRSLSARRAWIEIWLGVWIVPAPTWSLSARRAWIEIVWRGSVGLSRPVALRKESVDRNLCHPGLGYIGSVALRKESVDRNVG